MFVDISMVVLLSFRVNTHEGKIFGSPDIHSVGKESACNAGDQGSILGLGISPGEGNGNTF